MAISLGIVAALLQFMGYIVYGFKVLRKDILPNPASWLMFAYGTSLLVILEWDQGATTAVLALPIICAFSSIGVAFYSLRKTKVWWPEHVLDRFSFMLDIILTVAYMSAWILLTRGLIDQQTKNLATTIILICWNAGILTAFFPLLRQVYHHPSTEHAVPWVLWTGAYGILSLLTLAAKGAWSVLLLYPMINFVIHASIAARMSYWHWNHMQLVMEYRKK